ncbi:MAG: hypothetical protein MJE66_18655 [Proteobacteria bacterium]|nr:hypothetical protein [Pseudomonadota bacterium]
MPPSARDHQALAELARARGLPPPPDPPDERECCGRGCDPCIWTTTSERFAAGVRGRGWAPRSRSAAIRARRPSRPSGSRRPRDRPGGRSPPGAPHPTRSRPGSR